MWREEGYPAAIANASIIKGNTSCDGSYLFAEVRNGTKQMPEIEMSDARREERFTGDAKTVNHRLKYKYLC